MRAAVVALSVALAFVAGCAGTPVPPAPAPGGAAFSVLTYNVNYAAPRPDEAIAAVAEADADVVCLQETNPQWERIVRDALGSRYQHVHFRHAPGAGGIAVLSKWPVCNVTFHRAQVGWFPACIATVNTPAGPVQVVGVHLRPPVSDRGSFVSGYFTTPAVRRDEIEELYAVARERRPAPEVIAGGDGPARRVPQVFLGDFNEGPGGRAIRFLRRRGFRDSLPSRQPYASTWRWQAGPIPLRGQLDHVLHSPYLRCVEARVLRRGASDHYPVYAGFTVQEGISRAQGREKRSERLAG